MKPLLLLDIALFVHILGVIIGAGGAFITDIIFFHSLLKHRSFANIDIIALISIFIWVGVATAVTSGLFLLAQAPDYYLTNPQYAAKMTIVMIIFANGTIFHFYHLPLLQKLKDKPASSINKYPRRRELLLLSGAFSSTSWVAAALLGSTLAKAWPYGLLITVYFAAIGGAGLTALALRNFLMPSTKQT